MPRSTVSRSGRSAKGPASPLPSRCTSSAPVDDGPLGGAREDEAHPRYLGHRGGETRPTALDLFGVEWLGAVEEVDKGIRAGRHHADAVALIRLAPPALRVDRIRGGRSGKGVRLGPPDAIGLEPVAIGRFALNLRRRGDRTADQLLDQHALEWQAPAQRAEVDAGGLAVIGEHEEIVAVPGNAPDHAPDLADGGVDAAEGVDRMTTPRAEGMGRDVVVQEVDVDRGQPRIGVARRREGEELPHPHRDADVELQPLPVHLRRAGLAQYPRHHEGDLAQCQSQALQHHPADHDRAGEDAGEPSPRRPTQPREAEQRIVGPAGEHAPVHASAGHHARAVLGVLRLHELGMAGARKVDVHAAALIVIVEPGNVRPHAVHQGHLEGRRGSRHAHRHGSAPVPVARQESPEKRHAAGEERTVEHLRREPVDLHDDEAPVGRLRRTAHPHATNQPIEASLQEQGNVVDWHRSRDRVARGATAEGPRRSAPRSRGPRPRAAESSRGRACPA